MISGTDDTLAQEVTSGYSGDLLSWVMGKAQIGDAWVTIMSNVNVAAVAELTDVACVILAENVKPDAALLERAIKEGLPLFSSELSAYELCVRIGKALE
jgi:hypothetical protein